MIYTYIHFRLSIFDCIQFGAGGYRLFGTVRRLIDDYVGRLHSAQVSAKAWKIEFQWKLISEKLIPSFCCSSIPIYLSWLKYLSWMMYANEAMTIIQWEGIENISMACMTWAKSLNDFWNVRSISFQLVPEWIHDYRVFMMRPISLTSTVFSQTISTTMCGQWFPYTLDSIFWHLSFCGSEQNDIADFNKFSFYIHFAWKLFMNLQATKTKIDQWILFWCLYCCGATPVRKIRNSHISSVLQERTHSHSCEWLSPS